MTNRTVAPLLAPLARPSLLPYEREVLPNGIEVIITHDSSQEVFKLDVVFEAGICYQPQPLTASTAINMLNEGTQQHSAEEIAEIFDYHGAYIDYNCGFRQAELSLISLNKYAPAVLSTLEEMIACSTIPEKELEIFLRNKRQEFLVNQEKTAYLARREFSRRLFGDTHPYANLLQEKDYTNLSAQTVRDFYHQHLNANHCRIVACGNISPEIRELIRRHFSSLTASPTASALPVFPLSPCKPGSYKLLKENAVQSSLRIGKEGVRITDKDYASFQLLNTVLGGYFGSRLMSVLREEKGYTYGVQSFNVTLPTSSYWCIATDVNKEATGPAIDAILQEIRRLQNEPVPEEELTLVKNYLYGDLLRELDGVFAQSDALKHKLNYHLDNRVYLQMIEQIKACTPEQLLELANRYWQTDQLYVISAGAE